MSILFQDDNNDNGMTESDAVAAMLSDMEGEKAPEADEEEADEGEPEGEPEAAEEDAETEEEAEGEPEGEPEAAKDPAVAGDEQMVKVTVDGEELSVTVKDLKRLYGQEASLTRKSQELADRRKEADQEHGRAATLLAEILTEAEGEWSQYADIDWAIASRQLDDEEFAALRQAAKAAHDRFQNLSVKADQFVQDRTAANKKLSDEEKATALETVKSRIEGWSEDLYGNIRKHAVEALGFDKDDIDNALDPRVIVALHKARLYDLSKAKAPLATKKIVKAPAKVLKSGTSGSSIDPKDQKADAAFKRFKQTGSEQDALAALMSDTAAKRR